MYNDAQLIDMTMLSVILLNAIYAICAIYAIYATYAIYAINGECQKFNFDL
jgi:hypothetical protein